MTQVFVWSGLQSGGQCFDEAIPSLWDASRTENIANAWGQAVSAGTFFSTCLEPASARLYLTQFPM